MSKTSAMTRYNHNRLWLEWFKKNGKVKTKKNSK